MLFSMFFRWCSCVLFFLALWCATFVVHAEVPHTFVPNTPAKAEEVNANFQALVDEINALKARVAELEAHAVPGLGAVASMQADSNGYATLVFSGVNVQIVNGMGATNGDASLAPDDKGPTNGLGNLVLGYNEPASTLTMCSDGRVSTDFDPTKNSQQNCLAGLDQDGNPVTNAAGDPITTVYDDNQRHGSHNLVIGMGHSYTSHGGIISGHENGTNHASSVALGGTHNIASGWGSGTFSGQSHRVSGRVGSITGGFRNYVSSNSGSISGGSYQRVSGVNASISGGRANHASGTGSSISGGLNNIAHGSLGSIFGGRNNEANGIYSSILGGENNVTQTTGFSMSVSGGINNTASARFSHIAGGENNIIEASGDAGTITGGSGNVVSGYAASISGGFVNTASGAHSVISGGRNNTASDVSSSVSGGAYNTASGGGSSVSGGRDNNATAIHSSISGGRNRSSDDIYDWVGGSITEDD